jgi:hypothetical protein
VHGKLRAIAPHKAAVRRDAIQVFHEECEVTEKLVLIGAVPHVSDTVRVHKKIAKRWTEHRKVNGTIRYSLDYFARIAVIQGIVLAMVLVFALDFHYAALLLRNFGRMIDFFRMIVAVTDSVVVRELLMLPAMARPSQVTLFFACTASKMDTSDSPITT